MGIAQDVLTISETAEELNLKDHQVRKRISRGDLKAEKRGWIWFVHRSSVDQFKKKLALEKR